VTGLDLNLGGNVLTLTLKGFDVGSFYDGGAWNKRV
jgi:hypothetical protein